MPPLRLLAAAIGGVIAVATTVYVQHNENANGQEATIQNRAATLIAVADQINEIAVMKPLDATKTQQLQGLSAQMESDYFDLLLASQEPVTSDAQALANASGQVDQLAMNTTGEQVSQAANIATGDITQLEDDINPSLVVKAAPSR